MINLNFYNTSLTSLLVSLAFISGCGVTSRIEPYKQSQVVVGDGEGVVVLARKHHASHEAEQRIVDCISEGLSNGDEGLNVHNSGAFEDTLYPLFEPSMEPIQHTDHSQLLE